MTVDSRIARERVPTAYVASPVPPGIPRHSPYYVARSIDDDTWRTMRLLVTGGCGFIGSNFIRYVLDHYQPEMITNVDALTYASSMRSSAAFSSRFCDRYEFFKADIADAERIDEVFSNHCYFAVVNFAAESHVDRS